MEDPFQLLISAIALEAAIHLLRNLWDADLRAGWTYSTALVTVVPVLAAFLAEINFVGAHGLDFAGQLESEVIGYLLSGLVVGRLAQLVHNFYKKAM